MKKIVIAITAVIALYPFALFQVLNRIMRVLD